MAEGILTDAQHEQKFIEGLTAARLFAIGQRQQKAPVAGPIKPAAEGERQPASVNRSHDATDLPPTIDERKEK